jgi:hypothetical protein
MFVFAQKKSGQILDLKKFNKIRKIVVASVIIIVGVQH